MAWDISYVFLFFWFILIIFIPMKYGTHTTKYERKHDANETTLQKIYDEKKMIAYIKFVCIGSFDLISDLLFETHFSMHTYAWFGL